MIRVKPIKRITIKGREAKYSFNTGLSKRILEMKRLIPNGGMEAPISKLVRKIIPR